MVSEATLTVEDRPDLGVGVQAWRVVCEHGPLTVLYPPGDEPRQGELLAKLAVEQHYARWRCTCTDELRRRSGLRPNQLPRSERTI